MSGLRPPSSPSIPTDVAMAIAKLLGFDLCPRLKALKDRHLFLPHGRDIPEILRSICHANIDLAKITAQWEQIVHLVASVHSGHTSAIQVLARFGAAARGDPLYEVLALANLTNQSCRT
jgi:TnpA family transposase